MALQERRHFFRRGKRTLGSSIVLLVYLRSVETSRLDGQPAGGYGERRASSEDDSHPEA